MPGTVVKGGTHTEARGLEQNLHVLYAYTECIRTFFVDNYLCIIVTALCMYRCFLACKEVVEVCKRNRAAWPA